ncbi:hypothetical protein ONZ45_g7926 [Pleurotus djamor]|nr:hypothetical protein ONZ45_g7926 [Pleurotus djamor]
MFARIILLSLSLSLLPSFAAAHGFVRKVVIDGKTFDQNVPNARAVSAATRQINDVSPVKGANNKFMGCGPTPNPATLFAAQSLQANPGSTIEFDWAGGDQGNWPHNTGPMLTYMADCGEAGCEKFDATKAQWFKVQQVARKKTGNKEWAQQDLMNGAFAALKIPDNIAPGNYLIRHEIIALHLGTSRGGAEFYPSCTQLKVGGNGTGKPKASELVSFPGAYRDDDPGIFFPDAFNPNADYPYPGPPIASFVNSQSSNGANNDASNNNGNNNNGPSNNVSSAPANSTSSETSEVKGSKGSCHQKKRSEPVVRPRHISRIMRRMHHSSALH